jgi:hypothetical protein
LFSTSPVGCKDLNDALKVYGVRGVTETITRAQWMLVDGVYRMSELPPLPECKAHDPGIHGLGQHYRLRLEDFAVITGIPSHGKTAFVTDVACRMVSNYGWGTAKVWLIKKEGTPASLRLKGARAERVSEENSPQSETDRRRKMRKATGYRGLLSCGKSRPKKLFCFHSSQVTP